MNGMAHDVTSKSARIQAAAPGPLPRLRRDEAQGWIAGKAQFDSRHESLVSGIDGVGR